MDGSRSLKRPSDGEPSGSSKCQRVEGQTSRGFGLGPAGRDHRRFTGTTREAYDQAGTSDHRRSLDQASPSRPLTEPEQPKQRQAILAQQLAMLARLDKIAEQGQTTLAQQSEASDQASPSRPLTEPEQPKQRQATLAQQLAILAHLDKIAEQGQTNSSDQVQKDARSNKRQEINFAPPASPLHEQQQQSKENDRDLLEAHGSRRDAPIQSSRHHFSDAPFQKHPLDNLRQQDLIEQQQDIAVQQHEMHDQAGPSHQGDARPARTEKRKSHQTLSPKASKYQRQDTASSPELLEDFAASLEAELRNTENQADARPAHAKKRQDMALSSSKSLEAVSARLKAEFTKQDTLGGLNRDGQEELVLRKIHSNIYNNIISRRLNYKLKKAIQGKGRYTQEELLQSKEKLQALRPEIMNGTKEAYDALQGIIKNPSNDAEKSAAQLLIYHMTRKD